MTVPSALTLSSASTKLSVSAWIYPLVQRWHSPARHLPYVLPQIIASGGRYDIAQLSPWCVFTQRPLLD